MKLPRRRFLHLVARTAAVRGIRERSRADEETVRAFRAASLCDRVPLIADST